MDAKVFHKLREIIYEQAGIHLPPEKETLVSARVAKRLRALNLTDESEYLRVLVADDTGEEMTQFLNVISTNFTSFFREADHFDHLAEMLRDWRAAGQRRFRVWSAAASSGEEPFTISLVMHETFGPTPVDARVLATDISTKVLEKAVSGLYEEERLKPLSRARLQRYFTFSHEDKHGQRIYRIAPELQRPVVLRRLNLSQPPYPMSGPFDAVFCRNVMIYFDRAVRQRLVDEIARLLRPGGLLYIGHTETLTGLRHPFLTARPSVLVKPAEAAA
jgi:chemotaxis protein methyltransferase CheR